MERQLYLALGDSITRGYSATNPAHAYANQVGQQFQGMGLCTELMVIAQNGWTTQNLWRVCRTLPESVWHRTQVLTLMVGGNDLRRRYYALFSHPAPSEIVQRTVQEFEYTFGSLCRHIAQYGIPHVIVSTIYNPLPNSPLASRAISKMNEVIRTTATSCQFDVVEMDLAFAGREAGLIHRYRAGRIEDLSFPFSRPIHPNDAGHRVIASEMMRHIFNRLDSSNTSHTSDTVNGSSRLAKRRRMTRKKISQP